MHEKKAKDKIKLTLVSCQITLYFFTVQCLTEFIYFTIISSERELPR